LAHSILLVRHGVIAANRAGRWHGSTDSPLLWRGKRQAKRTGRWLAKSQPAVAAIYASPLQRCQSTAQIIARQSPALTVQTCENLREYAIGDWEDMAFSELAKQHDFVNRATADLEFAPPGGESLRQVAERFTDALTQIDQRHSAAESVLVVSHGAIMAVGLGTLLDNNPARWVDYNFGNCSVTQLVMGDPAYVEFFNATDHL